MNENGILCGRYKHTNYSTKIDYVTLEDRVNAYASRMAARLAKDEEQFDSSALSVDDRPFMIYDAETKSAGLITFPLNMLSQRLNVFIPKHEEGETFATFSLERIPDSATESWKKVMDSMVFDFVHASLVSQWFDMLGIKNNVAFANSTEDLLANIRRHVDALYVPIKIPITMLGI